MKTKILKSILTIITLILSISSYGQYNRDWNTTLPMMQYGGLHTYKSTVDNDGNTYLAASSGSSTGTYFVKYNPQGVLLWQQSYTDLYISDIKVSPTGFIYLATSGFDSPSFPLAIRKFNRNGSMIWVAQQPYPSNAYYRTFNFDHQGNIITTGSANTSGFAITEKYDTLGNLLWKKQIIIGNSCEGHVLTIDSLNNIYVGLKNGIVKYSAAGNELWNLPLDIWMGGSVAVDHDNNIYFAGITNSTHLMGINKVTPNGNLLWTRTYGYGDSYGNSIVFDLANNVYVSGSAGSSLNPTAMTTGVLLKYSPSGNLLWSKAFRGTATSTDGISNVYQQIQIKPYSQNNFLVYGTFLNDSTVGDGFLAQIDTSGRVIWQDIFHGNDSLQKSEGWRGLNLDRDQNIYLDGVRGRQLNSNHNDILLMKYNRGEGNNPPTIQGNLYYDLNQSCTLDSAEARLEGRMIELRDYNTNYINYAITDTGGNFNFYAPIGNYKIKPVPSLYWMNSCNNGLTVSLSNNNDSSYNNELDTYMLPNIQDLQISVAGGLIRAGRNTNYIILGSNVGTIPISGSIAINHDSLLHFESSYPAPDTILNGKLIWVYDNLPVGENKQIQLTFSGDTTLTFQSQLQPLVAVMEPMSTDFTPFNNVDTVSQIVFGPYDPNYKSVNLKDTICENDTIFKYTIQFQNLGNDTAFDITIRDTLNDLFKIPTLKLGASSFPYSTSFVGNVMTIKFKNISLPPKSTDEEKSQGFIKFSINRKAITRGTEIKNKAAIYFDYMPPIVTNTTYNVYPHLSIGIAEYSKVQQFLKIFPNPTNDKINISGITEKSMIQLFDSYGKLVLTKEIDGNIAIDVTTLKQGIYIITAENKLGRVYNKVVITK